MAAEKKDAKYMRVTRVSSPIVVDAQWDKAPWTSIEANVLSHYMGEQPAHFPKVEFKAAYDDEALYIIWKVEDRYVVAVAEHYQDAVYKDSCVEFFFTPGEDVAAGYFNLEMNCGGTALFNHQTEPWTNQREIAKSDFDDIEIAHSLSRIISPEITDSLTWTLEYRMPFSILEKYARVTRPGPGKSWRVNFYKCADASSHPHWLTWAAVDFPRPNFHLPQFFGTMLFEETSFVKTAAADAPERMRIKTFPEPFNDSVTVEFHILQAKNVELTLHTISGMLVRKLASGWYEAGQHRIDFNAKDLPSGAYFIRLADGQSSVGKKITLTK